MADRFSLSPLVERALGYVPPAVLTAITVPAVLMPHGRMELEWGNSYLFAALASRSGGFCFPQAYAYGFHRRGASGFLSLAIWPFFVGVFLSFSSK